MEAALQPWSTSLLNSEYISVQDLFQVWAQRWYRAVGMLRNSPWPCVWFKSANVPESSSSSQGFNLKRWTVLANETASQFSWTACLFQVYILFYTFTKTLVQRFDIFSSPSPRFIVSTNHCCSSEFLLQWFSLNQTYHLSSTFSNVSYS